MTDWPELAELAPTVDDAAARAAFTRTLGRQRRRRRMERSLLAAALILAALTAGRLATTQGAVDTGPAGHDSDDRRRGWTEFSLLPEVRMAVLVAPGPDRVLVFGGIKEGASMQTDGFLFDPASGRYTKVPTAPLPMLSFGSTALSTGDEFIVWGTGSATTPNSALAFGAVLDAQAERWRPMAEQQHVRQGKGTWTGREFVVVGAGADPQAGKAAAYDPAANTWRFLGDPPLPDPGNVELVAWTGRSLVAVDRTGAVVLGSLDTGQWRRAAASPMSHWRVSALAWTGRYVLQHNGGRMEGSMFVPEPGGALYDPAVDAWERLEDVPQDTGPAVPLGGRGAFILGEPSQWFDNTTRRWSRIDGTPHGISIPTAYGDEAWFIRPERTDPNATYVPGRLVRYRR